MDAKGITCEMEQISRDGLCGRPTKYVWHCKDGTEMPVCDQCVRAVYVCGGDLMEIDSDAK